MKYKLKFMASAIALGCAAFSAHGAEVTLKAVSAFSKDSFFDRVFEEFVKKVNAEGKGILQINYIGGPESMPPFEVGNALRAGVVDFANTTGVFHANLVPEAVALSFTQVPMATLRTNGGYALMDKIHREKANITWLGRGTEGLKYHIYTNKKPENGSFEGMKLRSVPVYRTFFQALGAAPLQVPPGEVYTALERGMVDGYGWPGAGIFDLGWQEKTKYRIDPGFYNVEGGFFMNQKKWESLEKPQQEFLQKQLAEVEANFNENLVLAAEEQKRLVASGVEIIELPQEQAKAFVAKAEAAAWKTIDESSPKYAPELRKLLGGEGK